MLRILMLSLVSLALVAAAKPAPAKKPVQPKEDTSPKLYESAEHKLRLKVPANWTSAGGGCEGSIFNFLLPRGPATAKKVEGNSTTYFGDMLSVAVNAPKEPAANLDDAAAQIQEMIKAHDANAEFKPLEKARLGGSDAVVLVAQLSSKDKDQPRRAERHIITLRDGKIVELMVLAHTSSLGQATAQLNTVARSFQWIEPAPTEGKPTADAK